MASSQTANYKLNQWAASDQFLRTEFNADNSKIDAALKALNTLSVGKAELVFGSYVGNDATDRTISLGFTPRGVLLGLASGRFSNSSTIFGGLAMAGKPVTISSTHLVEIVTNGFQVRRGELTGGTYYVAEGNSAQFTYYYMAVK